MLKPVPAGVPVDESTKAEAIALIRNGLGKAELEIVGSYVAPLFWNFWKGGKERLIKSGTTFFLDTGTRVFGVTAAHVVQECFADTKSPTFDGCMVGSRNMQPLRISLGDRLIDGNSDIDIATFDISEKEIAGLGHQVLRGFNRNWPPQLPDLESGVMFAGFPATGRRWFRPREITFGLIGMTTIASSVREECISIQIEREGLIRMLGDKSFPENFDFGGVSGGPVVAIYQSETLRGWFPAGIIFQGPNPGNDPHQQNIGGLEIIRARPIRYIKSNGQIDLDLWQTTRF